MTAENISVDLAASIALLAAFCSGAAFVAAAALPRRRTGPAPETRAQTPPCAPPVIAAPADWKS